MRRARIAILTILLATFAAAAEAVTLKDIVDLTKAGLGEDVLIALIEVDGGVFNTDAETLTWLKAAGVSEKVIIALVRSGRVRQPQDEPQTLANIVAEQQAPAPEIRYVERPATTVVQEVAVPVPVYVSVPVAVRGRRGHSGDHGTHADVVQPSVTAPPQLQSPLPHYLTDRPAPKTRQPEYWGSGGKLRPDAWKPE